MSDLLISYILINSHFFAIWSSQKLHFKWKLQFGMYNDKLLIIQAFAGKIF